ncbi:MAG: LysR substrate-binding domain-containing protein, partial [Polaromonas sp.]
SRDGIAQAQSLRIGASTTIGSFVLPRLLGHFLGERPSDAGSAWRSSVTIGNTEAICDAVAAFELDIGLIEGPCHQASLAVTPWLRDELVVVARPNGPSGSGQGRVALKALRDMVWLLREAGSGTRAATDQLLTPHLRSYRRSIELGSTEAIKHAAAEGIGVACLSQWAVGDMIAAGRLQRLPTTLPVMRRQCYLVVHRDKQPTPALLRFTEKARRMTQAAGLTTSLPLAHSEAESSGHAGKRQGKFFNTME